MIFNVKGSLSNGERMLAITTMGMLQLQPVRCRYNYVTYENDVTTRVLRTYYVSLYVFCLFLVAMLT